jgi:hypothetical protein
VERLMNQSIEGLTGNLSAAAAAEGTAIVLV